MRKIPVKFLFTSWENWKRCTLRAPSCLRYRFTITVAQCERAYFNDEFLCQNVQHGKKFIVIVNGQILMKKLLRKMRCATELKMSGQSLLFVPYQ